VPGLWGHLDETYGSVRGHLFFGVSCGVYRKRVHQPKLPVTSIGNSDAITFSDPASRAISIDYHRQESKAVCTLCPAYKTSLPLGNDIAGSVHVFLAL